MRSESCSCGRHMRTRKLVLASWIGLLSTALAGCVGESSGLLTGGAGPGDSPGQTHGNIDQARFFAGQALYDRNCGACHGLLEESTKRGRTAEQIANALASLPVMKAFESRLTPDETGQIAYALSVDPTAVTCAPIEDSFRIVPKPRRHLENELASLLELPAATVRTALAGYQLGYDGDHTFDNQDAPALIQVGTAESLLEALERIASQWVGARPAVASCANRACVESALTQVASRWGPALVQQVPAAAAIFDSATREGLSRQEAVQLVLVRLLMSPEVIFTHLTPDALEGHRRLIGALGSRSPAPAELALPLPELTAQLVAADTSVLADRFALGWWGVHGALNTLASGDQALLPVAPELLQDLAEEARRTFRHAVDEDVPLTALMTSQHSFINNRLATHYGVSGPRTQAFERVELGSTRGGGLLALGAVHVASGGGGKTSVVMRGKWVLDNLLCQSLPPPPDMASLMMNPGQQGPVGERTPREASAVLRASPSCEGCHAVMDEIGFGLEGFDPWGAPRSQYASGAPVETWGQLPGGMTFDDHRELAARLGASLAFRHCSTLKLSQYLLGRSLTEAERCHVRKLSASTPADITMRQWIQGVVSSELFHAQKGGSR